MATQPYSPGNVTRSYHWLDHHPRMTEVSILHPDYQPGDKTWNQSHQAWPITRYVHTTAELLSIVREYAGERLVCYGLNPRPRILTHPDGRLRSAKEADITGSQTLLLDLDLHGSVTPERLHSLVRFLSNADESCTSLGIARPVRASTGRGSHLLFAYPPITVAEHPDVRDRLRAFKTAFTTAHRHDLNRLEAVVDSTQDLRRMVRVYGTTKPGIGITSHFYGNKRVPDPALRSYLLGMTITPKPTVMPGKDLHLADLMPDWFPPLLQTDSILHDLWHGKGKHPGTDQSNSGYDYTIATYLASHGITDHDAIATIIAFRPTGSAERARKGVAYLLRTVTSALARHNRRHPAE